MTNSNFIAMQVAVLVLLTCTGGLANAQPASIPPPAPQQRANCASPTYASDMRVCADPELLALDERMAGLLARQPISRERRPWIEEQEAWFRRRSRCAFQATQTDCLRAAYAERIAVLEASIARTDGERRVCKGGSGLHALEAAIRNDGVFAIYREGLIEAVGLWRFDARAWTPFVKGRADGRKFQVTLPGNKRLTC
jgi:uncharacterized protein